MDEKHEELRKILESLATLNTSGLNDKGIDAYIENLKGVYSDSQFRHLYSEIFAIISSIDSSPDKNIHSLSTNLKALYKRCSGKDDLADDFKTKVKKLYDHVNLDVARIEYTKKISDNITSKNTEIIQELQGLKTKAQEMQKEYVTILGIFSSIVLTFVAGMVFSSSILSNIDKVNIYHLVFVMLLIGLLIFNLFYFQFEYIQKINGKPFITAKGETSIIYEINKVILGGMLLDAILWIAYLRDWI